MRKDLWEFAHKLESAFSTAKATFWVSPLKRAKAARALGEPALKGGPMRLAFGEVQTRSPLKRAVDGVNVNCSLHADSRRLSALIASRMAIVVCMQTRRRLSALIASQWTLPLQPASAGFLSGPERAGRIAPPFTAGNRRRQLFL